MTEGPAENVEATFSAGFWQYLSNIFSVLAKSKKKVCQIYCEIFVESTKI